jgi:HEAT repeat protein
VKYILAIFLIAASLSAADNTYELNNLVKTKTGDELLKMVQDDKLLDNQRWPVIVAAARQSGEKAIPLFQELLNKKKYSWYIRTAIAQGLVIVGGSDAVKTLHTMLNDRSLVVRTVVVDALGDMMDPTSLTPLTEEMKNKRNFSGEQSLWIRKHLIDAIARTGKKKSIPVLITYLDDPDKEVAVRAKKNLADYVKMDGKETWSKRNWIDWWMQSGKKI